MERDLDRCTAWTIGGSRLVICDRPATWTLTVTERPGTYLDQDVADMLLGPQGRCEEHARPLVVRGPKIEFTHFIFEIQPRSES